MTKEERHHPSGHRAAELAPMSIEECRACLEGLDLSDEEVERLRDAIYTLVRQVFDEMIPW